MIQKNNKISMADVLNLQQEFQMGKKLKSENFKLDERQAEQLRQAVMDLDLNKSEIIRACLEIGLPIIRANPLLVTFVNTIALSASH